LHSTSGIPAAKAAKDDHLRPNQLLAVTLKTIAVLKLKKGIIKACSELLVPGAIRSLADRDVKFALHIKNASGTPLNNPNRPYFGNYRGDENNSRKPAYHNGTAWTWLFPSFAEAFVLTYGEEGKEHARAILSSSSLLMKTACIGNIPEILDGNSPHSIRGCGAQAWGASELYRVLKFLDK
jgi:glycogen debranching enzyme